MNSTSVDPGPLFLPRESETIAEGEREFAFLSALESSLMTVASTKQRGDIAELAVAMDLKRQGFGVAFPFGEDCDYDLIVERDGALERVQVKYASVRGDVVPVRCYSNSLTNGKVRNIKRYTSSTIDWIAVFEPNMCRCFYVPASELGEGRREISLRVAPTRNRQAVGVRMADDYERIS